jgi:hypothetical protein
MLGLNRFYSHSQDNLGICWSYQAIYETTSMDSCAVQHLLALCSHLSRQGYSFYMLTAEGLWHVVPLKLMVSQLIS